MTDRVVAFAPGRVNLMGDHTDYAGGLALPIAIDLGTTVRGIRGGERVVLTSTDRERAADLPLSIPDPGSVEPAWGRYLAGVVAELQPDRGLVGAITSTLPIGAGLSSSAALELAVALAMGFAGPPRALAHLGQRAEQRASGVPCGLMDQLTSACGIEGHALLIDFSDETILPVRVPDGIDVIVVHSGEERALATSAYARRRAEVESAIEEIGPLRDATTADARSLPDAVRRRARHVITENVRVRSFAAALASGDTSLIGPLMAESHLSLRSDFEVSTAALDETVSRLTALPGVLGVRLTGAGFGGCVVTLTEQGAIADPSGVTGRGWIVRPSTGARTTLA